MRMCCQLERHAVESSKCSMSSAKSVNGTCSKLNGNHVNGTYNLPHPTRLKAANRHRHAGVEAEAFLSRTDSSSSTRTALHPGDLPLDMPDDAVWEEVPRHDLQHELRSRSSPALVSQQYWERLPPPRTRAVLCTAGILHILTCERCPLRQRWRRYFSRETESMILNDLAQILLECTTAEEDVDLASLPSAHRAIVLSVNGDHGIMEKSVGRQHQSAFFQRMLPQWERIAWISRTHVKFSYDRNPSCSRLRLTRFSRSPVSLNGRRVGLGETVPVKNNMKLVFHSPAPGEPPALAFDVRFRTLEALRSEGQHPAALAEAMAPAAPLSRSTSLSAPMSRTTSWASKELLPPTPELLSLDFADEFKPSAQAPAAASQSEAVLECIYAKGADLERLPAQAKLLRLPLRKYFEIGRTCPYGFFEHLLQAEPKWAAYVSRRHCQLYLALERPDLKKNASASSKGARKDALSLSLENLSPNVVLLNGTPVPKGTKVHVAESEILSFTGSAEEILLKFIFRPFAPGGLHLCTPTAPQAQQHAVLRRPTLPQLPISRIVSAEPVPPPPQTLSKDSSEEPIASKEAQCPSAVDVVAAVLECVYTVGNDLAGLPQQAKALGIPIGVSVEIGRLCQPGFFEKLLQGEPQWITQLSRKHCRLQLSLADGGAFSLLVENVGTNVVFVDGQKLANACGRTLAEGGTLGFAAAVSGTDETRFLKLVEFMLRREPAEDYS